MHSAVLSSFTAIPLSTYSFHFHSTFFYHAKMGGSVRHSDSFTDISDRFAHILHALTDCSPQSNRIKAEYEGPDETPQADE